jgi:ubiquinone/menaquinone biosynthesis C-methylase UbiE
MKIQLLRNLGRVTLACFALSRVEAQADDHAKMHSGQTKGVAEGGHMDRHFDQAEEWAKEFDDPARDKWQMPDKVVAALKLKRGQVVADLGAGTGYFSVRLAKSAAAPKVLAVDIEPSMIAYLGQRAAKEGLKNLFPIQASPESANLPEPVDLILIVDTYHHLADRSAYLRKLAASLKPNGRLAIVDFRKGGPMGPPDEFRFTPDELIAELKATGFKLEARHYFLPNQMFLIFRK